MTRFTTLSFDSGTVGAGGSKTVNVAIPNDYINIHKIKIVPSSQSAVATFEIYKKDTFLAADRLYRASSFTGTFVDPVGKHGDLKTERSGGFLCPYEDDDASQEIHIKISNNYSQNQSFQVSIYYEQPTTSSPAPDVDPIEPGASATLDNFGNEEMWIPIKPTSKFGMDYAINGNGSVTFSTSVDSASGQMHGVCLQSRFWVMPDLTTGCIVVRSAWQNVNLKPTNYTLMNTYCGHGLCTYFNQQSSYWGAYAAHTRSNATTGYFSQGNAYTTPSPQYNVTNYGSSQTLSWPIGSFQIRNKKGRCCHYASNYWLCGQDERITYFQLEAAPWESRSVGGGAPPYDRGGEMCDKYRLFVGFWVYDYLESGLYATCTEIEVEEGIIVPF